MTKHAYAIIQYRIDVVKKLPAWVENEFAVGDEVIRTDATSIFVGARHYRVGESYTKFKGYTSGS